MKAAPVITVGSVAGALGAAIGYLIGHPETARLLLHFGRFEVSTDLPLLAAAGLAMAVGAALGWRLIRRVGVQPTTSVAERFKLVFGRRAVVLIGLALVVALAATLANLAVQFSRFSKTYYPNRIQEHVSAGQFKAAAAACEEFRSVFPKQAGESCREISEFNEGVLRLQRYLRQRNPNATSIEGVSVPVAKGARDAALEILGQWAKDR